MSSTSEPAVRAGAVRDTLDFFDKFQPGARERALSWFPAEARRVIEETSRLGWIPVEHDHWVVDGIVRELGRERAVRCWADSVATLTEQPLLKSFVGGALRVLGNDPVRFIGMLPKGWSMIWRDMCEPRVDTDRAGRPVLVLERVDPLVQPYPNYFHSWHGAAWGTARLTGRQVHAVLDVATDRSRALITFTFA